MGGTRKGRARDVALMCSAAAHAFAWAASLWLALWPFSYHGFSVTPVAVPLADGTRRTPAARGEPSPAVMTPVAHGGEAKPISASLIEVNGVGVLALLLVPLLLTGGALLAALLREAWPRASRLSTWASAALLSGFCLLGAYSIGLFYLPAAASLLVAAVAGRRRGLPSGG